jgi:signal transduction histidine kinase
LQITVADAGEGLSPAEWQAALSPFNRLRAPPSDGHTGLGLALVERLVRAIHGNIDAVRTASGFAITVKIPAKRLGSDL